MQAQEATLTHPGLIWLSNGQSVLKGSLLRLYQRLDRTLLGMAGGFEAEERLHPAFVRSSDLDRLDYFKSFPHLATFPVALDRGEANLKSFSDSGLGPKGELSLTTFEKPREVLTPAACYHLYPEFEGHDLVSPLYLTTRNTCFRREEYYLPLQRQWAFSMREIVCVGSENEVLDFLARAKALAESLWKSLGLDVTWQNASDPFFQPRKNVQYMMQILDPSKSEMVYRSGLALGSVNFHRGHFGHAFDIKRGGQEASSGCMAFGLERWIFALLDAHGPLESSWPDPAKAGA